MKPKILLAIFFILFGPILLKAQSLTTEALRKKHSGSLELFFYNNTLRMLNHERELAERIEQSIKQLRTRGQKPGDDPRKQVSA